MFGPKHEQLSKLVSPPNFPFRQFVLIGIFLGVLLAALMGIQGWDGEGWVGPDIPGMIVGIAVGFAFGLMGAAILAALHPLFSWISKSRWRIAILNVGGIIMWSMILFYKWEEHGWAVLASPFTYIVVLLLIGQVMSFLFFRAKDEKHASLSSEVAK